MGDNHIGSNLAWFSKSILSLQMYRADEVFNNSGCNGIQTCCRFIIKENLHRKKKKKEPFKFLLMADFSKHLQSVLSMSQQMREINYRIVRNLKFKFLKFKAVKTLAVISTLCL